MKTYSEMSHEDFGFYNDMPRARTKIMEEICDADAAGEFDKVNQLRSEKAGIQSWINDPAAKYGLI